MIIYIYNGACYAKKQEAINEAVTDVSPVFDDGKWNLYETAIVEKHQFKSKEELCEFINTIPEGGGRAPDAEYRVYFDMTLLESIDPEAEPKLFVKTAKKEVPND